MNVALPSRFPRRLWLVGAFSVAACLSSPPDSASSMETERLGSISQRLTSNLLHSFEGGIADGQLPGGSLTLSGSILYGMTSAGGASDFGTVFKLNTDGTGFSLLHSFGGASDGWSPNGSLTLSGSTLYGMTTLGGPGTGGGTLFKVNTDGTGFSVLHFFGGPSNGALPYGSLTLSGSILYGMTAAGGASNSGTLFQVNVDGTGFSVLHSFTGGTSDGRIPYGSLTLLGSTLYGMSSAGDAGGVLFKVNTDGTSFSSLHSFQGGTSDGALPYGSLTASGSTLYGMTVFGGASNGGTLFKVETDGTGFSLLRSFPWDWNDRVPDGFLTLSGSTLYGMTYRGGASNGGTLFKIETDGTGFSLLHSFAGGTSDGKFPAASLTLSGSTLYGMTSRGGASNRGTVFRHDVTCGLNEHVVSQACVACAVGSTRPVGDDPAGFDTTCTVTMCVANEHVASNACVPCAPGSTRAAGDLATGADTACTVMTCAANEHVASNACVPCTPGTTRAAGDLATGANTACTTTACSTNEHVASNACVSCTPGSTRPAGDLATGPDTQCDVEPVDSGASPASGPNSGTTADSSPTADSGRSAETDASPDSGGGASPNEASNGCSCTTTASTGTSHGTAGVAAFAGLAVAALRRRRNARSEHFAHGRAHVWAGRIEARDGYKWHRERIGVRASPCSISSGSLAISRPPF
jgi:MYXO-CTERM domain-containing protein